MELNLTRNDRRFLRSIRIDPETPMADAVDIITAPTDNLPWPVPEALVRKVVEEFGEFTATTYWAYVTKFGNGDKRI